MRAAVILHGEEPWEEDWRRLEGCDVVVCTDGAAAWLQQRGIVPSRLVGDMDSITDEALLWMEARGVPIDRHDAHKDFTDGELALESAMAQGATDATFVAGTGRRTAMTLANLRLLRRCRAAGVRAEMASRGERIRLLGAGEAWTLGDAVGGMLNVLPLDGAARVRLVGTGWTGDAVFLPPETARGVSNPIVAPEAAVEVQTGLALIVVEAAPRA